MAFADNELGLAAYADLGHRIMLARAKGSKSFRSTQDRPFDMLMAGKVCEARFFHGQVVIRSRPEFCILSNVPVVLPDPPDKKSRSAGWGNALRAGG